MRDELSIFFENPASDPLGKEIVEGKVLCDDDQLSIRYKQKDRAFKKNQPKVLEFSYAEIESVSYKSKLFGPKILTICTRGTDKLKAFPGAEVAMVNLHVVKGYRDQAEQMADFIEYHQSEAYLKERESRLSEARGED